jgi:hypothetical protein
VTAFPRPGSGKALTVRFRRSSGQVFVETARQDPATIAPLRQWRGKVDRGQAGTCSAQPPRRRGAPPSLRGARSTPRSPKGTARRGWRWVRSTLPLRFTRVRTASDGAIHIVQTRNFPNSNLTSIQYHPIERSVEDGLLGGGERRREGAVRGRAPAEKRGASEPPSALSKRRAVGAGVRSRDGFAPLRFAAGAPGADSVSDFFSPRPCDVATPLLTRKSAEDL